LKDALALIQSESTSLRFAKGCKIEADQGKQQAPLTSLDGDRTDVEQLHRGNESTSVVGPLLRFQPQSPVGMPSEQTSGEQTATHGEVREGYRDTCPSRPACQHIGFEFVILLHRFLDIDHRFQFGEVRDESRRQGGWIERRSYGFLYDFLESSMQLRCDHRVGQARRSRVGAARRPTITVRIVPSEHLVEDIAGIS